MNQLSIASGETGGCRISRVIKVLILAMLLVGGLAGRAEAGPFTSLIVYGDSLSDNGNQFALTGGAFPPPPYIGGRASDGPVAVEYLAAALGIPLVDFAVFGATTGVGNSHDNGTPTSLGAFALPGMAAQAPVAAGPDDLFVVWGGPNDFFSPSPGDAPTDTITRAVTNLVGLVVTLQTFGAQHILVPGMPDLGLTPALLAGGPAAAAQATAVTTAFNTTLASSLPPGVLFFDSAAFLQNVVANPALYGLTNVTTPCFNQATLSVCANPDQFLFWDIVHPTTAGHALFAQAFEQTVVPEPSTLVLALSGLAFRTLSRKRRRR
jgi:phospholipase/lecithinase/hemolysin